MAKNADGLRDAKKNKKDEFYTDMDVISAEIRYYRKHFENAVVFCNCDDPFESNFFKYFALNFNGLKLKKLIATCYKGSPVVATQLSWFEGCEASVELNTKANKKAYKIEINEVPDVNNDGAIDITDVEWLIKHGDNVLAELKGDGDFRSDECIELLKEADIVCTNPPFSLFREYLSQLVEYNKRFLIIGNVNALTYKEVFPLIKDNELWLGASIHSGDREFRVPDDYPLNAAGFRVDEQGNKYIRVKGVRWFTNLDYNLRHEELDVFEKYTPEKYPKYDNYDAINVDKTTEIPRDYTPCWFNCPNADNCEWAKQEGMNKEAQATCENSNNGVMGVPITFIDKHCPEQFEIVNPNDYRTAVGGMLDCLHQEQTDGILTDNESMHASSFASKCNGVMGVPITFMDKYCPEQFEIIWIAAGHSGTTLPHDIAEMLNYRRDVKSKQGTRGYGIVNGNQCYHRLLIRRKQ